jgi:CheY-like chemotaxis protein
MKGNIRLMIIDDDADDRMLFIEAVKEIDEKIECLWAKDGLQALEDLRNEALPLPDYIFLDLRMPRVNGKKCLSEMKSDSRLKEIP